MQRAMRLTLGIAMFGLYVWLCQWFYIFHVIDTCADAGVGYDSSRRACMGLPFGEIWDTGARASYWFWLILLGVPAIPVVVLNRLVSRIVSRVTM